MAPEQTQAKRHPIDFEQLNKGDKIGTETIEKITGVSRNDWKRYELAVLTLKEQIEKEMAGRGTPVVIKIDAGTLLVLTDSEAVQYLNERHRILRRQITRNHGKSVNAVDVRQLTEQERLDHERGVLIRSKELQAMESVRKHLSSPAYKRSVPGLPQPTE